jgi:hypothetical protein
MKNPRYNLDNNKINFICYLLHNYGVYLEHYENEKDSYSIFKTGLEFALSLLGDVNLYTGMFRARLSNPIYQDAKKFYFANYGSLTHSESRDSSNLTNTKSIDNKSIENEDLLSKSLKRVKPKKLSLRKHLEMNNSPPSKENSNNNLITTEKKHTDRSDISYSMISAITHSERSDLGFKTDDSKNVSIDNFKIEIKTGEETQQSVETIVQRPNDITIKPIAEERKSNTIDNVPKKTTSRLKELFSMAVGSSSSIGPVRKRNSINNTPKLAALFDKLGSIKKKPTSQNVTTSKFKEISQYHEVMNSIDHTEHSDLQLSSFFIQVTPIDQAVKQENYNNFVEKFAESANIEKLTGLPHKIKPKEEPLPSEPNQKDMRIEINGKKYSTKDILKNQLGKKLLYETGKLYDNNVIINEIDYKICEDNNNCRII